MGYVKSSFQRLKNWVLRVLLMSYSTRTQTQNTQLFISDINSPAIKKPRKRSSPITEEDTKMEFQRNTSKRLLKRPGKFTVVLSKYWVKELDPGIDDGSFYRDALIINWRVLNYLKGWGVVEFDGKCWHLTQRGLKVFKTIVDKTVYKMVQEGFERRKATLIELQRIQGNYVNELDYVVHCYAECSRSS